jgi:hypothetical protein
MFVNGVLITSMFQGHNSTALLVAFEDEANFVFHSLELRMPRPRLDTI